MTEEIIDPDQEFSIQDSTEEFETQEETSDTYEPSDVDFDQDSSIDDQPDLDLIEPQDSVSTEGPVGTQGHQDPGMEIQTTEPEQKTSSPQSFRVMRFEDFQNQSRG